MKARSRSWERFGFGGIAEPRHYAKGGTIIAAMTRGIAVVVEDTVGL
jgi:hypothetical protein